MVSASSGDYYQKTQQPMDLAPTQKLQTSTWKAPWVSELKHIGKDAVYGALPALILRTLIPTPLFNDDLAEKFAQITMNTFSGYPILFRIETNKSLLCSRKLKTISKKSKTIKLEHENRVQSINLAMKLVKEKEKELQALLNQAESPEENEEAFSYASGSMTPIAVLEKMDKEKQAEIFSLFLQLVQTWENKIDETRLGLLEGIKDKNTANTLASVLNTQLHKNEAVIKSLINDIATEAKIERIIAAGKMNTDEIELLKAQLTLFQARREMQQTRRELDQIETEVTVLEKSIEHIKTLTTAQLLTCWIGWTAISSGLHFAPFSHWHMGALGAIASVLNGLATRHLSKI